MRTLPQTPNLEYLKQQAKDLLGALRETQPTASLADAQRTLAQQYGFRTWTDLKVEVERLRAQPELADPELASGIAKAFDLGDATAPAVVVAREVVMGPSIRLETGSGRWSAQAVLPWMDLDQAEEAVRLMEAAAEAGVQTPKPVRSPAGSLVEEAAELRWRVDEWMELGPSIAKPVSAATAAKAGELLGTLHRLRLAPARGMSPWLTQRRTPERWREILTIVEDSGATWSRELAAALPAIIDISAVGVEPPARDLILSLTNLIPGNLRLGRGGSLVVHRWEYAGAITPAWDLGLALGAWTEGVDDRLHEAAARPLLEAYVAATGERPALDVSMFSPSITAWLNWLVSRMNHALEGEGDERERATKELLNMLAFPLTREKLERILRAAEGVR